MDAGSGLTLLTFIIIGLFAFSISSSGSRRKVSLVACLVAIIILVAWFKYERQKNYAEIARIDQEMREMEKRNYKPPTNEEKYQGEVEKNQKAALAKHYREVVKQHKRLFGRDHWCDADRELLRLSLAGY